jgi:transposase
MIPSAGSCTPGVTSGSGRGTSCQPTRRVRKKLRIRRRLRELPPRSVRLCEDETDLRLFPPLRAGWGIRGEPAPVPISGVNAKRTVFGALNIDTGYRLLMDRRRQRGEDFREFLRELRGHYRGWHVALVLDEDSSHQARDSQALAAEWGIELLWLPKHSPHLNPMDHLWRHAKQVVSANRQYADIEEHVHRFTRYLYSLTRRQALRKAGVLAEDFWLRD